MARLIFFPFLIAIFLVASSAAKISPSLFQKLEQGVTTANVIVNFIGGNKQVVNSLDIQSFPSKTERLNTLKSSLEHHAFQSQENLQTYLRNKSVAFKSFWVSNQIYVPKANKAIVEAIADFVEVEEIREELIIPLDYTFPLERHEKESVAEWGIERIQAVEAWNITKGAGVVVCTKNLFNFINIWILRIIFFAFSSY